MPGCMMPDSCVKAALREHLAIIIKGVVDGNATGDLLIKVIWIDKSLDKPVHEDNQLAGNGTNEDGNGIDTPLCSSQYEVLCQTTLRRRDIDYAAHCYRVKRLLKKPSFC